MTHPEVSIVVEGLSRLIFHELTTYASEQATTIYEAEVMDSVIKDAKAKAAAFRDLRDKFEDIASGVIR